MSTEKAILIKGSSLYVNQFGELMATEDFKRFFPIDGMYYLADENDVIVVDNILPYQYSSNGLQEYYQLECKANEASDGNNGSENGSDSKDNRVNYYELEENEDVQQFIDDMDSSVKGCMSYIIILAALAITLCITMCR